MIFSKSAFNLITDLFTTKTFEKREISSAKTYTLKLFHQVDNWYKLKTEEDLILVLVEFWKNFLSTQIFAHLTQLFVLHCEDNFQVIKGINPQRHMHLISKMRPSCQTSSNAFEISRKTPLTSTVGFSANAVCISCIIDDS